jgi:hypothetical protein
LIGSYIFMIDSFALVLAVEFPVTANGVANHARYFERSIAQALANQLSFEIAKHLPSLEGLGLVWMAACYDQAQILRPEFPIHTALKGLYQSGTREGQAAQVMTLQALRGQAPMPILQADESLLGGPLVLVPFALVGEQVLVHNARQILEEKLLDAGLTDARTAMMLNQALAADAEHARLMTLDDLAALCAIQLDNAGLMDVWIMIERALFNPASSYAGSFNSFTYQVLDKQVIFELGSLAPDERPNKAIATQIFQAMQAGAILQAHGIHVSHHPKTDGAVESHADFWIDWHLDGEIACLQAVQLNGRVFGYELLNAEQIRIAWATPMHAKAQLSIKQRFTDAVYQTLSISSE